MFNLQGILGIGLPFWGCVFGLLLLPGRSPGLTWGCPFGAGACYLQGFKLADIGSPLWGLVFGLLLSQGVALG